MIINTLGFANKKYKQLVTIVSAKTIKFLNQPDTELTIKFVSCREIKRLNKTFRNINKVTDVLSFPATNIKAGEVLDSNAEPYLGDCALCLAVAKRQAKQFGTTLEAEIQKLVVHSILHLLGYDHISDSDYEVMSKKEEQIKEFFIKENICGI